MAIISSSALLLAALAMFFMDFINEHLQSSNKHLFFSYKHLLLAALAMLCMAFFNTGLLSGYNHLFVVLFCLRYLRTVVNFIIGVFLYQPALRTSLTKYTNKDTAVIIPTVAPDNPVFARCVESILANCPCHLIISTVGAQLEQAVKEQLKSIQNLAQISIFVVA